MVLSGRPGSELATQSRDVDLMIVGSRGYGPMAAVMLGGTTHALIRDAACPVVVLPHGTEGGLEALIPPGSGRFRGDGPVCEL
jgi:hypothetical protein